MGKENSVIETGVDKLVNIIREKKRVSVQDAAKELGVGPIVVEEWADFLEEEGLISIEYKFATPYLIERKLSQEEIKDKENEFHSKKEGFVRKAEVTLAILDREGEDFQKFKNRFDTLKKELGSDLQKVEGELKQLEKYESIKKSIDKELQDEEKEFREKIGAFDVEITREQEKYSGIIKEIDSEEERLDKERLETLSLREKEMQIKNKINQFQDTIKSIKEGVKENDDLIEDAENRIKELKKKSENIKKEVMIKNKKGKKLLQEGRTHSQKIIEIQKEIINKTKEKKEIISKNIDQGRISTGKFREFFDKKAEIEKLIKEMDNQKDELENELIGLIKKAKAFHLSSSSTALKGHVKELEKTYSDISKNKDKFEKEAIKLSSLLKS